MLRTPVLPDLDWRAAELGARGEGNQERHRLVERSGLRLSNSVGLNGGVHTNLYHNAGKSTASLLIPRRKEAGGEGNQERDRLVEG